MRTHPGRTLSALVIGSVAVLGALGLVLAVEPGTAPAIILVGAVAGLVLYGGDRAQASLVAVRLRSAHLCPQAAPGRRSASHPAR